MSKAILTLPMMPVDGKNYGKYVTPIICECLRNTYDGKYYHCVNLLDSFNDRSLLLDNYIKSLHNNGINYDELWLDNKHIDILLENLKRLIRMGYVDEIISDVYRCDCGIVEIEESKIHSCNPLNLKFEYINGKMYCKSCGSRCQKYSEKLLIFTPKNIKREDIIFLPNYLNKDAKTYENIVLNSYLTISRVRNTGIQMEYNNTNYNIDIDFLWATYLANFSEKEKIVVSGNKMSYQLFLVGMLEKCFCPDSRTILLGTPYIENIKNILENPKFINDDIFRKLSIIFSMKWQSKNVKIDDTVLKCLKKLTEEDLKLLYSVVCNKDEVKENFIDSTNDIIKYQFNMQKSLNKMKKERNIKNV